MKNTLSDSQILFASHSSLRLNVRDTEDEEEWMSIDCIRRCVCVCLSIKFIKNVNNHNINISNFINHTTTSINFAYHKITTQNCRYNQSAREGTIKKKLSIKHMMNLPICIIGKVLYMTFTTDMILIFFFLLFFHSSFSHFHFAYFVAPFLCSFI